jgi:hypothetical protein
MYAPPALTNPWIKPFPLCVSRRREELPDSKWGDSIYWDKETIRSLLGEVKNWQIKHRVADQNIFVGECGVCREVTGAQRYLFDVLDLFTEFKWSWAVFAFRDDEWDAMNHELGADLRKMFSTTETEFFVRLKSYFK